MTREVAKREIESLDYYLQNHTDDYSEESHTAMMMAIQTLTDYDKMQKISLDLAFENDELMNELDSIKNVLAEIKGEIQALDEGYISYQNDNPWVYKSEVLAIIDKHIGKSEKGGEEE